MAYAYTHRTHRLTSNPVWSETDLILPTLVVAVLRQAVGDLADVDTAVPDSVINAPETLPAIRVRARGRAWQHDNRLTGQLIAVSFHPTLPLEIEPSSLINPDTGYVSRELASAIPGTDLRIRSLEAPRLRKPSKDGQVYGLTHKWSATASLHG